MKQAIPKLRIMKRTIPVFVLAASMVACNTNPNVDSAQKTIPPTIDTTGYAQFQAWKAQNELANTAAYNANAPVASQPQTQTRTVVKYYPVSSARRSSSSSTAGSGTTVSRKRGWSSAAKGAVIGGVAGAAGGAIINKKNRTLGGVVGGILGAGAGYGIGRGIDKRNGRY